MVNSQNLFREYILFRSRMAVYAAVALALLVVIGLVAWFVASPANINRFGLLLQLLGVLALVPEVVGKEKFPFLRKPGEAMVPSTGPDPAPGAEKPPSDEPFSGSSFSDSSLSEEQFLSFYRANNLTFMLGNILASVALAWLLVDGILAPRPEFFPSERLWRLLFAFLGFAWLNFFMIILVYRLAGFAVPRGVLAWFFAVDLFVGILGVIFAGMIHIVMRWIIGGLRFLFENGVRRVLLIVTLPFFAVGLFFELIATLR